MQVTVVKIFNNKRAIEATKSCKNVEEFILFAMEMGVAKDFQEFINDYQTAQHIEYSVYMDRYN